VFVISCILRAKGLYAAVAPSARVCQTSSCPFAPPFPSSLKYLARLPPCLRVLSPIQEQAAQGGFLFSVLWLLAFSCSIPGLLCGSYRSKQAIGLPRWPCFSEIFSLCTQSLDTPIFGVTFPLTRSLCDHGWAIRLQHV